MIVLLLLSLKSWSQNLNDTLPLRAELVTVPINYIKDANIKLTERKYLIKLNSEKDSIITYYKQYTNGQSIIIKEMSDDFIAAQKINENIKRDLELQKHKTRVFIGSTVVLGIVVLINAVLR